MSTTRKKPIRHPVTGYKRGNGRYVHAYWRGKGMEHLTSGQRRRVVRDTKPFIQISSPVKADVTHTAVVSHTYDYKEMVTRPVSFRITLVTADDARGHENEEWLATFVKMFPTLDNSLREGYTIKDVIVFHDPFAWDKWVITLSLKHTVPEIDTKEVESAAVERIARATLPRTGMGRVREKVEEVKEEEI